MCSKKKNLDIDHKNPREKEFELSGNNLNWNWERVWKEAQKCQILCRKCHIKKTSIESKIRRPVLHGTVHMYLRYKCKCEVCVSNFSQKRKNYPSRQLKKLTGTLKVKD